MVTLDSTPLVWGIVGNLGGGKTLTAVQMAVSAMLEGKFVATNIVFNEKMLVANGIKPELQYMQLGDLDGLNWDEIPWGSPRGSGGNQRVVVIIDEIAEWFDQYSSTSHNVKDFLTWLRHSSKRGQDVILICQRAEYIAKSLRILIARWVWVDDMAVTNIPVLRWFRIFIKPFVMQRVFDRLHNLVKKPGIIKKSDWGIYYNTAQILRGNDKVFTYVAPPVRNSLLWPILWALSLFYALS